MYEQEFQGDVLYMALYAVVAANVGHWLNNIYSTREETIRTLAAQQLCRPGAQGGVAEHRGTGRHHAMEPPFGGKKFSESHLVS